MKQTVTEQAQTEQGHKVRGTHLPVSMFFAILLVLLLMSGVHVGLIVGINTLEMSDFEQTLSIIVYWILIAVLVTLWLGREMRKVYEEPMKRMAEATGRVANGDFSVYIPPLHTPEKLDYLDVMIMDFNRMVEELGGIETVRGRAAGICRYHYPVIKEAFHADHKYLKAEQAGKTEHTAGHGGIRSLRTVVPVRFPA